MTDAVTITKPQTVDEVLAHEEAGKLVGVRLARGGWGVIVPSKISAVQATYDADEFILLDAPALAAHTNGIGGGYGGEVHVYCNAPDCGFIAETEDYTVENLVEIWDQHIHEIILSFGGLMQMAGLIT